MIAGNIPVRAMARSCLKMGQNLQLSKTTSAPTLHGTISRSTLKDACHVKVNIASRSRQPRLMASSWSALATLGITTFSVSSVASVSSSAVRVVGTSVASTAAIGLLAPFILPQGADAAVRAAGNGKESDDDDAKKSRGLLMRIFGGKDDGEQKDAKVGKGLGGLKKDPEKANKFMADLKDTFTDFRTAKAVLVGVGLAFGSLQLLSYMGYVELNYKKIEGKVMGVLDFDEDGKVSAGDFNELYNRVMKVMAFNLPAGSGFAAGALVGARFG